MVMCDVRPLPSLSGNHQLTHRTTKNLSGSCRRTSCEVADAGVVRCRTRELFLIKVSVQRVAVKGVGACGRNGAVSAPRTFLHPPGQTLEPVVCALLVVCVRCRSGGFRSA